LDRGDEGGMVAAGQIRAADRSGEQRIADEQVAAGLAFPSNLQADAAGTMAGCVVRARLLPAERDHLASFEKRVDRRLLPDPQAAKTARTARALSTGTTRA